jgi:flagellum-specific peptidoglycan hydrolase FlgJ
MSLSPDQKKQFLLTAYKAAQDACHPFPDYAACEAALESAYGTSGLTLQTNDLFGQKYPTWHPVPYSRIKMMTHEWDKAEGKMITVPAYWPVFPDYKTAFVERMVLLKRLAKQEPGYAAGLRIAENPDAKPSDGAQFVIEVSKNWSTDPDRAKKVIAIHDAWTALFIQPETVEVHA